MTVQIKGHQIASSTITGDHIASDAAIAESKLSLSYATHDDANDPSADEKAALAGQGTPSAENPFACKSYVDSVAAGLSWQPPVIVKNLLSDTVEAEPGTPTAGDSYILAAEHSGTNWTALTEGNLVQWSGTAWTVVKASLSVGDRLLLADSGVGGSYIGKPAQVAVVTEESYDFLVGTDGDALVVVGHDGYFENCQYTYDSSDSVWIQVGGLESVTAGAGLTKTANTIDVIAGDDSILVNTNSLAVQCSDTGGLETVATEDHEGLAVKLDTASGLVLGSGGVKVQAYEEEVIVAAEAKATWELAQTPVANTLRIYVNGSLQRLAGSPGEGEYSFLTKTATFGVAIPVGEWLFAQYLY